MSVTHTKSSAGLSAQPAPGNAQPAPGNVQPAPGKMNARHVWPKVPSGRAATLLALQYQMARNELQDPQERDRQKFQQLHALLIHAGSHLPFVKEQLIRAGFSPNQPLTQSIWSNIPILTRENVRENTKRLTIDNVPEGHGRAYEIRTSGSTGMPLTATGTGLVQLFWDALTLREADRHQRDSSAPFHAIRRTDNSACLPGGAEYDGWGRAFEGLGPTGKVYALDIESDIDGQLDWLTSKPPRYLLTYPTNLAALVRRAREREIVFPTLQQLITVSETVTPQLRKEVRDLWNVPVMDLYSAQEVGYIALQATDGDHYHVPEDVIHVEILDEAGHPVAPGETGRVVVTHLHNYAMPLIRYDIGDYAELGERRMTGNTQMVLNKILGRSRGMLSFPDGSSHWPHLPYESFEKVAGVKQYQLIQHALNDLEFRCVLDGQLSAEAEKALTAVLQEGLRFPFNIRFSQVENISRSASGKFEDFISKV